MKRIYSETPLLEMAGIEAFVFRWPTLADEAAIHAAYGSERSDGRFWAAMLHRLCGIPLATATRLALTHRPAVAAMFGTAFRRMRAALPKDDPRLDDVIPAIVAGGNV